MAHIRLGKLTKRDHRLLRRIAKEIRAHPDKYRSAGEWLDENYSEKAWFDRRKDMLKEFEKELREFKQLPKEQYAGPIEIRERAASELRESIEKGEVSQRRLLWDAAEYLEEKCWGEALAPTREDGRRVLLLSWLLYDPDTEAVGGTITKFAQWPWKSQDDPSGISTRKDAADSFWRCPSSGRWKESARWAMDHEEDVGAKQPEDESGGADKPSVKDTMPDDSRDIEIDPKIREQEWREDSPDYASITYAAVTLLNNKITPSGLSRRLKNPGNTMRWMRTEKPKKLRRVHIADLMQSDIARGTASDFSKEAIERRMQEEHDKKINRGQ